MKCIENHQSNKERKVVVLIQLFFARWGEREKTFKKKNGRSFYRASNIHTEQAGLMEERRGPMAPRIWEVESGSGTLHPLAPFVSLPPPPTAMADPIFI